MYSSLGIIQNERPGNLTGTHQKLDRAARMLLVKHMPEAAKKFPDIDEILHFEGAFGPDGLKRKSPGVDEPEHFIEPGNDNGVLIGYIRDHQYNLTEALKSGNTVRASFEAAWLAHALTDGLTPAHHFPYRQVVDELMSDKDYAKLFGVKIKGIMRGNNLTQTARNNWLYWGAGGVMTKHIAFEYGVAYTITPVSPKHLIPKGLKTADFRDVDFERAFYSSLEKIATLDMYNRFLQTGWNTELIIETREILVPEIVRVIALNWAAALQACEQGKPTSEKTAKKSRLKISRKARKNAR